VPEILMSGNHAAIAKWRHEKAVERTKELRPDLAKDLDLSGK
jgi:tRNA (guanine37-N1)-methyltransferase